MMDFMTGFWVGALTGLSCGSFPLVFIAVLVILGYLEDWIKK